MSQYINKAEVKIAEVARLNFYEVQNQEIDPIGDLIVDLTMHIECMRNIYTVIGQTLAQFDENVRQQTEANKKMN